MEAYNLCVLWWKEDAVLCIYIYADIYIHFCIESYVSGYDVYCNGALLDTSKAA